mmetsp:Transcript_82173/g.229050  ORF Transcript_82173/g.229050 Transcript_82173/m.229050 type:complete len:206 (+) Transcript_82173:1788-2405(+)
MATKVSSSDVTTDVQAESFNLVDSNCDEAASEDSAHGDVGEAGANAKGVSVHACFVGVPEGLAGEDRANRIERQVSMVSLRQTDSSLKFPFFARDKSISQGFRKGESPRTALAESECRTGLKPSCTQVSTTLPRSRAAATPRLSFPSKVSATFTQCKGFQTASPPFVKSPKLLPATLSVASLAILLLISRKVGTRRMRSMSAVPA